MHTHMVGLLDGFCVFHDLIELFGAHSDLLRILYTGSLLLITVARKTETNIFLLLFLYNLQINSTHFLIAAVHRLPLLQH